MAGWLIPAIVGGANAVGQWFGANQQAKHNKGLAVYQNEANREMIREQLEYDTPKNQMARFQDAGLNPNLVYGQGTPGNQGTPQRAADIQPADMQRAYDVAPVLNQTAMTRAQVQAIDANTAQTGVVTELKRLETQVMKKNPLLDEGGFKAIIDALKSTASIKASESTSAGVAANVAQGTEGRQVEKAWREVLALEQKFKLGSMDMKIKAEVLNSKEFQNAILEVQKRFLADGEIGPQQIYQFIQLLLMKSL